MNRDTMAAMITRYEDKRYKAYPDDLGIMTVGIGFNLEEPSAKSRISSLGLDYTQVCEGKCLLTDEHVMGLFQEDLNDAVLTAQALVHNFDEQPEDVQHVIVDMIFNMGGTRFAKFKKAIAAFERKDYSVAAAEMVDSKWYDQVGRRAKENVEMIRRYAEGV